MKINVVKCFLLCSIFYLFLSCNTETRTKAPAFSEPDISGNGTVTLSNYTNMVVMVNFWATWCPPCRAEVPDLIKLQGIYRNRLMIIGISVDREGSDGVLKFYKKYGMNYPVVMAKPSIIKDYGGITAIPTSFLVDVNGKIIKTLVGSRSFNDYEAEILPYLPR